ncbi:MAG TPA: type II toxin-antitoxin system RelE/ParE family toxin, partial [Planctomycetota bacterium]|nr:type II toxin-antitoxin system RelE/ParE family toxin [Planctomycetota bacterium]
MASYSVFIKRSAAKELETVDQKKDRARLVERIRELGVEPRAPGCEKLAGPDDLYRVRVGSFRIVYAIDDKGAAVQVVKVGH